MLAYCICFSLSDLLHSVWQTLTPSTSLLWEYGSSLKHSLILQAFSIFFFPDSHLSFILNFPISFWPFTLEVFSKIHNWLLRFKNETLKWWLDTLFPWWAGLLVSFIHRDWMGGILEEHLTILFVGFFSGGNETAEGPPVPDLYPLLISGTLLQRFFTDFL